MSEMTSRSWSRVAAVAAAVIVTAPAAALAQPGRPASSAEGAGAEPELEAMIQRGIELRRAGQDAQALGVFEAALARAPGSTRAQVHLASTHQALGQWVEADRYLSQALREENDPYVRRHRATLERAQEFLEHRLGSLDVQGGPEGAELWLSGRYLGQLPLSAPARVPIGSYVLEVRKQGFYPISRPLSIGGRTLLRERVELAQRATASLGAAAERPAGADAGSGSSRWLTWTLAGAGLGAGAASAIAFGVREGHAERWNSSDCVAAGMTRGQMCRDELESGREAERWGIAAAAVSGALLVGAAASFFLEVDSIEEAGELSLRGCGLTGAGARCFGSF